MIVTKKEGIMSTFLILFSYLIYAVAGFVGTIWSIIRLVSKLDGQVMTWLQVVTPFLYGIGISAVAFIIIFILISFFAMEDEL
jgi:hypothetical protein